MQDNEKIAEVSTTLYEQSAQADQPNAIVFGSGEVRMSDMIRVGITMNLVGVVLITSSIYLLGLVVFKINAPM